MPENDSPDSIDPHNTITRILIVEDDPSIEQALLGLLEDRYTLLAAQSGKGALDLFRAHRDIDLVLLDYRLPDMSGVEVLQSIKSIRPSIPVIFATGYGSEDVAIKAFTSGARDYVKKPFTYSDLERKIEFCLSLKSVCAVRRAVLPPPSAAPVAAPGRSGKNNFYKIQKAVKYMEKNFSAKVDLETAAARACLSKYHFSRVFREIIGVSFKQYLLHLKMKKAKELLNRSDLSVAETAYAVGYEETAHFIKIFKRHTGCTPSVYRKDLGSLAEPETEAPS